MIIWFRTEARKKCSRRCRICIRKRRLSCSSMTKSAPTRRSSRVTSARAGCRKFPAPSSITSGSCRSCRTPSKTWIFQASTSLFPRHRALPRGSSPRSTRSICATATHPPATFGAIRIHTSPTLNAGLLSKPPCARCSRACGCGTKPPPTALTYSSPIRTPSPAASKNIIAAHPRSFIRRSSWKNSA